VRAGAWFLVAGLLLASAAAAGEALPQQQDVAIDPEYSCIVCHTEKRRAYLLGTHSERGIRCHDCHGGNPRSLEVATAHSGRDYVGSPGKIETVELCSSCHSDPNQMRQYGLPAGELAEYRTSRHGMLLLDRGDMNAPTCTDCHDAHTILPPNDARSNVYPPNIAGTCARCHEDENMMGAYGLDIDQVETHRTSAHGVALYDKGNFASPTCTGCHGSHSALPPAVTEISNVCGHCHVLVRRAFDTGPHGAAARSGLLPGCTACHSNHGTERVQLDKIAETCTGCHEEGSTAAISGIEIQEQVSRAAEHLHGAEEAIHELTRAGRTTADASVRYQTALSAYMQVSQTQHSLDLEALDDQTRQVASISTDIRGSAEVAAEHQWEHKLLLIPIWFLALSATVLAWFKLRGLEKRGQ
jgi:predicted CXXCH cytochrome family protein